MFDFATSGGGGADFAMLGLGIDSSKAVSGAATFAQAGRSVTQQAGNMGRALGPVNAGFTATLGSLKALGAGFAAFKLAGMIGEVNSLAARYDELDVSLTAVGRNAGYSRPQLAGLEKDLQKTGISALQTRQALLSMMQANLDLTQATKLARVAQDVAVIGQINSSDALRRLTYGITSAQTEVLRTIGINVQFEAGYKTLAKSLGKTTAELTAQEKTQSRVNAVMKQAAPLMGLYEASMGSAGKQMRSTERYVEDLKVKVGAVFQPAYTTLVFEYAKALKELDALVTKNEDGMDRFGIALDAAMKRVLALMPLLKSALALGGDLLESLGALGQFTGSVLLADKDGIVKSWDAFGVAWQNVRANLDGSAEQIEGIGTAWDNVAKAANNANVANALTSKSLERFGIARAKTGLTSNGASDFFAPVGQGVRPVFDVFQDKATTMPTVDTRVTQAQVKAMNDAADAAKRLKDENLAETLKENAKEAANLRKEQLSLVESYRDLTPLEAFLDQLKKMRAEAKGKMPTVEFDKFEAAASRAQGIATTRAMVAGLREWSKGAKDALNDVASAANLTGDRVDPLVEKMKRLWEIQRDLAALTRTADRAERTTAIQKDLVPVLGQQGADRFQARVEDFEEKQRLMQGFVKDDKMDVTRATALADRIVAEQRRIKDAQAAMVSVTQDWVGSLVQGIGALTQMASLFSNMTPEARQGLQGGVGAIQGITALRGLKDTVGASAGIGKALSGGAGAAAQAAALSGIGAVVVGVAAVADAFDLFGTRAKERARVMEEAARQWNRALDDFARGGDVLSSVGAAIKALTRDAGTLMTGLAASTGLKLDANALPENYLTRGQSAALRAQAGEMTAPLETYKRNQLLAMADGIDKIMDTLEARIKQLAPAIMNALSQDFLTSVGRAAEAQVSVAAGQWQERLTNLALLLSNNAITLDQYNEAVAQSGTIFSNTVKEIEKADAIAKAQKQREAAAFDVNNAARIAAAGGDVNAAADIRRTSEYENELAEAREAGRDVTQLMIAQEKEWIQVLQERAQTEANARMDRNLAGYVRDAAIVGGPVAGQLAAMAAAQAQAVRAIQQDPTLTNEERVQLTADETRRGTAEFAAFFASFRKQFTDGLAGLNAELARNPIEAAILSSGLQMQQALAGYRDLLAAGVITAAEFAEIEAAWAEKRDRIIAMAKESALRSQEDFAVEAANAKANVTGTASDRFAAYALDQTTQVEQRIRGAQDLVAQGLITQEAFEAFAKTLRDSVAPALLETAFAAAEAARIMQQNLATLNQQWAVFGADANEQLKDVTKLFGFEGMSEEAIRSLFTRATPGVELTDAQMAMNDKIAQYFAALMKANDYNASQAADAERAALQETEAARAETAAGGGVTMNYTRTGVQTVSEGSTMRLVDISLSQLLVLRSIDAKSGGAANGGVTVQVNVSGASLNGMSARDAGNAIAQQVAQQVAPVVDELMGRQTGVERRLTGNVAIS